MANLQGPQRPPHLTVLWKARNTQMKLEPLKQAAPMRRRISEQNFKIALEKYPCFAGLVSSLGAAAMWFCEPITGVGGKEEESEKLSTPPPTTWYMVHPKRDSDTCHHVRRVAGFRGQVPGVSSSSFTEEPGLRLIKSQRWRRSWSVPDFVERRIGAADIDSDAFHNSCRICLESEVEVVALPCRHAVLCELCLRKHFYSKPCHRGGRKCPFCRTEIREVIRICKEAIVPMYGYSIGVL